MAEPVITTENKDKSLIEEIREKSFSQILNETAPDKPLDQPVVTEDEEKKKAEEAAAKEADEAKAKIEADDAARKRDEELAAKAAEDVIKKQKDEEQAKLDVAKKEEEAKEREERLKPKYTGKDADGNVVPQSYEELNAEAVRIAEEKAVARIEAELAAKEAEKAALVEKENQTKQELESRQKAYADQLQKELDDDLRDLYTNNKLPKVADPKDENDPGNKEFKNLFETAQKVNTERMSKGLPPIRSIKLIYYEHYKPLENPAGHDAPVMGSESTLSHDAPEDKYIPSRDRGKSMAQLLKEETQRMSRKIGIRGN